MRDNDVIIWDRRKMEPLDAVPSKDVFQSNTKFLTFAGQAKRFFQI